MTAIKMPYSVEDVARASTAVQVTDDEIAFARRRIADLREHCAPLHAQIAQLQADAPQEVGPDPDQVAALLADPTASPDTDVIAAAVSASRKADDVRNLTIATISQAVATIDADIAVVEEEISALDLRRAEEWFSFVNIARDYLVATFRARFIELRDSVMAPLNAIVGFRGPDGRLLSGARAAKLDGDTAVVISWYSDASGNQTERLYPVRSDQEPLPNRTVALFRASLPKVPAATPNET